MLKTKRNATSGETCSSRKSARSELQEKYEVGGVIIYLQNISLSLTLPTHLGPVVAPAAVQRRLGTGLHRLGHRLPALLDLPAPDAVVPAAGDQEVLGQSRRRERQTADGIVWRRYHLEVLHGVGGAGGRGGAERAQVVLVEHRGLWVVMMGKEMRC